MTVAVRLLYRPFLGSSHIGSSYATSGLSRDGVRRFMRIAHTGCETRCFLLSAGVHLVLKLPHFVRRCSSFSVRNRRRCYMGCYISFRRIPGSYGSDSLFGVGESRRIYIHRLLCLSRHDSALRFYSITTLSC